MDDGSFDELCILLFVFCVALVCISKQFICLEWQNHPFFLFAIDKFWFDYHYSNINICFTVTLLALRIVFYRLCDIIFTFEFYVLKLTIFEFMDNFFWSNYFTPLYAKGSVLYYTLASFACFSCDCSHSNFFSVHSPNFKLNSFKTKIIPFFFFVSVMERFDCGDFHRDYDAKSCKPDDNIIKKLE